MKHEKYDSFLDYFEKEIISKLMNEYFCNDCQKWFFNIKNLKEHWFKLHYIFSQKESESE